MAANIFLKFDPELKGESKQKGYDGQIEILSFSWGVSQAGGYSYGTGGGVAKANVQDLSVSFRQCAASPKIMLKCATGEHQNSAVLTCLKAGGEQQKYLEITLTDVVISSYQTGGSGDDVPIESMTLNFAKVKQEYFVQDDLGAVVSAGSGSWDQATAVGA
ncbi:MAG TPA: type VI secretion system tube protein Hcp [Longimicrobiaceae bacterium]|jgi:type VI secretion system secreted protein Hcp|nr:type VI secretion system tube protein Hcp [Longimicrobiaceae bacterium]